ncbi:hypothetical protein PIB30_115407, partial [Stylosanthes scabra]|nr:hypothetical protein [Stylosanthes scabra]
EAFLAELNRLQAERQALIEAGCPEPPPMSGWMSRRGCAMDSLRGRPQEGADLRHGGGSLPSAPSAVSG